MTKNKRYIIHYKVGRSEFEMTATYLGEDMWGGRIFDIRPVGGTQTLPSQIHITVIGETTAAHSVPRRLQRGTDGLGWMQD